MKLRITNMCKHFKTMFLFLAMQWPKNQVNVMKSFFENTFGICNYRASKQITFLESWNKARQDKTILTEILSFKI